MDKSINLSEPQFPRCTSGRCEEPGCLLMNLGVTSVKLNSDLVEVMVTCSLFILPSPRPDLRSSPGRRRLGRRVCSRQRSPHPTPLRQPPLPSERENARPQFSAAPRVSKGPPALSSPP